MRLELAALGLAMSGVLFACGGTDPTGTADSAGAPTSVPATQAVQSSEEATHLEPLDEPQCGSAELLTTVQVGSQDLTVSETTSGQWFCVSGEPIGLDSSPEWVDAPALTDSGSLPNGGVFYLFVLPADVPLATSLRDETGAEVPMAQALDGDHLIILDVDADAQRFGVDEIDRRWDLVGSDGAVLLTLTGFGPAAGSAPPTIDDVIACLAENGIDTDGPQPFDPALAQAAWAACEALDVEAMEASGTPPADIERIMPFVRCMAEQGWIQLLLDTTTIDVAAHEAAAQRCTSG